MKNVIVLADIDDNLCHTVKKFRQYVGDEKSLGEACVFAADGKPLSYRSRKQETFLDWLKLAATVVAITGRSTEKYRQVDLGFEGYAITSLGATIITPDGTPDPVWLAHITEQSALAMPQLHALYNAAVKHRVKSTVQESIVSDNGLELFLKLKDANNNQDNLAASARMLIDNLPAQWSVHLNEGQLCAYPDYLDKIKAATYFLSHLAGPHSLVIGSGDSLSDLGFMSVCDFIISPTQSQLFAELLKV